MCKLWVKNVPTLWKRKLFGVWRVVASKFRLLLEFCWVSRGGKNKDQILLFWAGLWLNYCVSGLWRFWVVVGDRDEIMVGCWRLKVGMKLLVVGGGDKIMVGSGCSHSLIMLMCYIRISKVHLIVYGNSGTVYILYKGLQRILWKEKIKNAQFSTVRWCFVVISKLKNTSVRNTRLK